MKWGRMGVSRCVPIKSEKNKNEWKMDLNRDRELKKKKNDVTFP